LNSEIILCAIFEFFATLVYCVNYKFNVLNVLYVSHELIHSIIQCIKKIKQSNIIKKFKLTYNVIYIINNIFTQRCTKHVQKRPITFALISFYLFTAKQPAPAKQQTGISVKSSQSSLRSLPPPPKPAAKGKQKKKKNQQYDLVVRIDLVSILSIK